MIWCATSYWCKSISALNNFEKIKYMGVLSCDIEEERQWSLYA